MRTEPGASAQMDSWYIQGLDANQRPYSCSFVEFDGRGDYLNFAQHTSAWRKIQELAGDQKILLVIYCHGWKNNSHSGDVSEFNEFLGRLSAANGVGDLGYRVHGIYLSWRGNLYSPFVDKTKQDGSYQRTAAQFGGEPIVNAKRHRRYRWTAWVPEQLSYWSRRRAAEHKVSSLPIARTIFTCASLTKAIDQQKGRKRVLTESSRVLVMGHSFGALLLEQALNATCLDPLIDQWTWLESIPDEIKRGMLAQGVDTHERFVANPLPIDFILFVNSAAPSIYSKTMRDFLTAHNSALRPTESPYADTPIIMSVTSSADRATGVLHPIANVFSRFYPSLQHTYERLLKVPTNTNPRVHQSAFYKRTTGHQPLLVDHWLIRKERIHDGAVTRQQIINSNLNYRAQNPLEFIANMAGDSDAIYRWSFSLTPPESDEIWAAQFGKLTPNRSSYWIVRCDEQLIRDHNDVWSDTAMQVYAALYRLVEWTRLPDNNRKVRPLFDAYWKSHLAAQQPGQRPPAAGF